MWPKTLGWKIKMGKFEDVRYLVVGLTTIKKIVKLKPLTQMILTVTIDDVMWKEKMRQYIETTRWKNQNAQFHGNHTKPNARHLYNVND